VTEWFEENGNEDKRIPPYVFVIKSIACFIVLGEHCTCNTVFVVKFHFHPLSDIKELLINPEHWNYMENILFLLF
jgi:hypothetical protein